MSVPGILERNPFRHKRIRLRWNGFRSGPHSLEKSPAERRILSGLWMGVVVRIAIPLASFAQSPAEPVVMIRDAGFRRAFHVARDEVYVHGPAAPRVQRLPAAVATIEEVVAYARRLEREMGEETELVLYEKGVERGEYTRRILTRQVLVELEPGADAEALAAEMGVAGFTRPDYAPGYVLFTVREAGGALALSATLRGRPGVKSAEPVLARLHQKKMDAERPALPPAMAPAQHGPGRRHPGH